MRRPTVTAKLTAKATTDSTQRRISANTLKHPKRQSGLVEPADEPEKSEEKREISPLA